VRWRVAPSIAGGALALAAALVLVLRPDDPGRSAGTAPVADRGVVPSAGPAGGPGSGHATRAAGAASAGARLRYPRLSVDAPITSVRAMGGVMQVPRNPHRVGWWRDGAAPGAAAGTVVFVGVVAGRGVVSVAHPGGLRTTYEPVNATVVVGAQVARGDPIGRLQPGHPGCPVAACLHWGLRRDDVYLDPLALLGLGRVRLLPLGAGE